MTLSTIVDRISERILGSPLAKKVEADLAAETLARRQAWVDELAALDLAELMAIRNEYDPASAHALGEVRRCEAALDAARLELQTIERRRNMASLEVSQLRDRLQRALLDTASPRLAACMRDLRAEYDAMAGALDRVLVKMVDGKHHEMWSNHPSVHRRASAILVAIDAVKALAFEPGDDVAIEARVSALREQLPAIEPRPAKYVMAEPVGAA